MLNFWPLLSRPAFCLPCLLGLSLALGVLLSSVSPALAKDWWPFGSHKEARRIEAAGYDGTPPPVDAEDRQCGDTKTSLTAWAKRPALLRGLARPHIAHLERQHRECLLVVKTRKRLYLESIERPSTLEGLDY